MTPDTRIDEIAPDVFRLCTWIPDVAGPEGFTFNQFLVRAEQPLLFHTGMQALFPSVSAALARLVPLDTLRWVSFGHVEADESGATADLLAVAPHAQVAHHELGVQLGLGDVSPRPAVARADGEVVDLGGHVVRYLATPHVPHGWEAQVLLVESAGVLLCGDLFTALGHGPALSTDDPVEPALAAERLFGSTAIGPRTGATLRRLAGYAPTTLALMHGPSWTGDGRAALTRLACAYDELLREQLAEELTTTAA